MPSELPAKFDVTVIGAGFTGLYALYRLREAGYSTCILEGGGGLGGTWYWNRYPGCRFDSESYTYVYSFDENLLREWDIAELYAAQPQTEENLNRLVDRLDLRKCIRFNEWVTDAIFDEQAGEWQIKTSSGYRSSSRFIVAAVGLLSAQYVPEFPGLETFRGAWAHTARWPKEGIDVAGKRVGVVGTGATGVQLIPEIAPQVERLVVFQRTANYCVPLRNQPIDDESLRKIRDNYHCILQSCKEAPHGMLHRFDPRSAFDVSEEERAAQYERLWAEPGFKKWLDNFYDIAVPGPANADYAEFIRQKIRERVVDPEVAEKLVPKDHAFLSKRPPGESGYYEVFNLPHVTLVDVRTEPIERVIPAGVETSRDIYEFDVLVFATGYDAVTGSLTRMNIVGEGSTSLKEKFAIGYQNYLGLMTAGFPNLFTVINPAGGNFVPTMEPIVDWVVDLLNYLRAQSLHSVAAAPEAERDWVELVESAGAKALRTKGSHWAIGANIPGKPRALLVPTLSQTAMRERLKEVATHGYAGFLMT